MPENVGEQDDTSMSRPLEHAVPLARPARLGTEVYDWLLRKLMSLEIEPEERISVDRLAREIGVSQTPIREALNQLEAQGLVAKVHLSGYRAAPLLTPGQIDDLCEVRLLLEPAAAARAAERLSPQSLEALRVRADGMAIGPAGDPRLAYSAFAQQDALFHADIARASGNALLHDIVARQRVHLHLFRLSFQPRVAEDVVAEHAGILDALHRRDPDGAAAAMRAHIESSHARFKAFYAAS